jgi:hypothetical protein
MKYLKQWNLFEASRGGGLTTKQIQWLDMRGAWSLNPQTGLVDIEGDFRWTSTLGKSFGGVKFGRVSSDFECRQNKLITLEGAPQEVGGNFDCRANKLTSIEGAPQVVKGDFKCSSNKITSLEGAPQEVRGNFECMSNQLTSLEGSPREVGGNFDCDFNRITSLEGSPQVVGGNFRCTSNDLTSLKSAPREVGGDFDCGYNSLRSLEGAPDVIGGLFIFTIGTITYKIPWSIEGFIEGLIIDPDLFAFVSDPQTLFKKYPEAFKNALNDPKQINRMPRDWAVKALEIIGEDPDLIDTYNKLGDYGFLDD